jgi:hypothetical protein
MPGVSVAADDSDTDIIISTKSAKPVTLFMGQVLYGCSRVDMVEMQNCHWSAWNA